MDPGIRKKMNLDKRMTVGMKNGRNTLWNWKLSFLMGLLMGAAAFLTIYGTKILDVTYDDWLFKGNYDLAQHYMGWRMFRNSGWNFPLGLCDNMVYPNYASIVFTDSLPVFSLIFKLLSPLLPEVFQFFGLYGLFCFMLQGGLAKLLLRRIFDREWQCNLGCVPFLFSASILQRMYYHTALASHWLILLGMLLFAYRDMIKSSFRRILLWALLGMLCVSVHFTIYGMVSVMFLGFVLYEVLAEAEDTKNTLFTVLKYAVPYFGLSALVFFIYGGLYGDVSGKLHGLGDYSANLNALFNPFEYSGLIKELPHGDSQYEGLAYIGVAAIVLMFFALPNMIRRRRFLFNTYRPLVISLSVTTLMLWFIALSPRIMLGRWEIVDVPWPSFITDPWSIFRSSGRFLWPVTYSTILIFMYFAKKETKKFFTLLFIAVILLQLYEYKDKVKEICDDYTAEKKAEFDADILELYDLTGYHHVQFMHPYTKEEYYGEEYYDQMTGYARVAADHGMTLSNFHFARDDMEMIKDQIHHCDTLLREGRGEEDTIYVMRRSEFDENMLEWAYPGLHYIYTENEVIGTASELPVKQD